MKVRHLARLDSIKETPLTRFFVCGVVLWRTPSLLLRRLLSVGREIRRIFKESDLLLRFSWNLRRVCRFAQSDFRYLLIPRVCFPFDAITRDVANFSLLSIKTHLRPSASAAMPVVPEPSTKPSGGQSRRMKNSGISTGKTAGWLYSCLPARPS